MFQPLSKCLFSSSQSRRAGHDRKFGVRMELLENRQLMSAVVVNTAVDGVHAAGLTSLRDAIAIANSSRTPTTITFSAAAFASPKTITLAGKLELRNAGHSTTITGPAAGVTISGNNKSTVFLIDKGVSATLSNMTISKGNSGGIINNGVLIMSNSTVSSNSTSNSGGGILNAGTASLTDCTISGNRATSQDGGGIYNSGTTTLVNVTIANNTCSDFGGGLSNPGTARLTNCTIAANTAGTFSGGIEDYIYAGTGVVQSLTLANTIVAGNHGGGGGDDIEGEVKSLGHNLIGVSDASYGSDGWTSQDKVGTSSHPIYAKLSALGNYGGPTQTMVPLAGSPAIDAGGNWLIPSGITTDERGVSRISNGKVDIGAVETIVLKISGNVFNDVNGDGIRATSDAGLKGRQVYVDLKNTGAFASGDPIAMTDASGNYARVADDLTEFVAPYMAAVSPIRSDDSFRSSSGQ